MEEIKGYDYGSMSLEKSPVTMQEIELLKRTLMWSKEDELNLRKAGNILKDQTSEVLDLWYDFVGNNKHLATYFSGNGHANEDYMEAVRERFEQWIIDLCTKPYDQNWLDYQHEIALRHHSTRKNKTDGVITTPIIHYRYMVAFIYPITATIRNFLLKKEKKTEEVDKMYNAWFKAVTLSVVLWTYPYIRKGEF
jgi:hypothetical protein